MKIAAIYWDVGGVLLRTEDPQPRQQLASRLLKSRGDLEELVWGGDKGRAAQLGEISAADHWRNLAHELGLAGADLGKFKEDFFAGDRLDATLVDWIRHLKEHYRTGVISNAMDDTRGYLTDYLQIDDAFDDMIFSAEVHLMKPDPRIYSLALDRLGVAPEAAVFVDDSLPNVDSARRVGMYSIHFRDPTQTKQALLALLSSSS